MSLRANQIAHELRIAKEIYFSISRLGILIAIVEKGDYAVIKVNPREDCTHEMISDISDWGNALCTIIMNESVH